MNKKTIGSLLISGIFIIGICSKTISIIRNNNEMPNLKESIEVQTTVLETGTETQEKDVYKQLISTREKHKELEVKDDKINKKLAEIEKEKQRKAEEKAKKEAEEKERKQYDTGITYNQLARNPEEYTGEKVKFKGEVIQVMEGLFSDTWRLNVGGNYNKTLYLTVPKKLTDKRRVLQDDWITICGTSDGIETYTTVLGGSVSIPAIQVERLIR